MSEVPYFEDTGRKINSRAAAIFGDKHAELNAGLTPTGQAQLDRIDALEGKNHNDATKRLAQLATPIALQVESHAIRDDMDQDRVDRILARTK